MNEFLLINALFFGGSMASSNVYIDISVGYHPAMDLPEVNLGSSIAQWEMGIEFNKTKIFYQHTSGLQTLEEGYGLNIIGVKYRIK